MPKIPVTQIDPLADPGVAVLNEHQAAKYLGMSVFTLRRMHRDPERHGRPPRKLQLSTNRVGYRKSTLDAWLAERELAS